jgi:hypothetical protein
MTEKVKCEFHVKLSVCLNKIKKNYNCVTNVNANSSNIKINQICSVILETKYRWTNTTLNYAFTSCILC